MAVRLRVGRTLRAMRRLPILPTLLLALVVVTGITAPWIAPHSPTLGQLPDRSLPSICWALTTWAGTC